MMSTRATTTLPWAWPLVLLAGMLIGLLGWLPWLGAGWVPKLQAFALWMLVLPAAACLVALLRRRWVLAALLLGCLLSGVAASFNPAMSRSTAGASGESLTVMSFNTLKAGAEPDELAEAIRQRDPDILVLVETSEPLHAALAQRGAMNDLGYRTAQAPAGGERDTVIFSRYRLTERTEELSAKDTGWYSLPVADVQTPQGPVTVAGIHIYPPLNNAARWAQGLAALEDWAQSHRGGPVILAGDFNSVRAHPQYRSATAGFLESSGRWPDVSWPAGRRFPPLVEIDHILASQAHVADFQTQSIGGSDHLGVVAELMVDP